MEEYDNGYTRNDIKQMLAEGKINSHEATHLAGGDSTVSCGDWSGGHSHYNSQGQYGHWDADDRWVKDSDPYDD